MFNIAVCLIVGPIFTIFLFHHYINFCITSYSLISYYPFSVWSIFCLRLSTCLLFLQYFLIYFVSFPLQKSISHHQLLVPSTQSIFGRPNSLNVISIYPILHAFHVLFIFFLCIFIPIFIAQPLCTSHPPDYITKVFQFTL